MAIAAPRPQQTEAPTQETGTLPRLEEQERRRVSLTLPRIAPGRYLAMEDGEDILLQPKSRVVWALPVMVLYSLLERHLVNAITAGAVKG